MNGVPLLYYFSSLLPLQQFLVSRLTFRSGVPVLFLFFSSPHAKVIFLLYSISYLGVGGAVNTYGCVCRLNGGGFCRAASLGGGGG